MRGVKKTGVFN